MKGKIFVTGLYQTEDLLKKPENILILKSKFCAILSIVNKKGQKSPFENTLLENSSNLHITRFHDLDDEILSLEPDLNPYAPQYEDIKNIIEFLQKQILL